MSNNTGDNDIYVICPYCNNGYIPEPAEYSEHEREIECERCGKLFLAWEEFSVTHHTRKIDIEIVE